MLGIDPLIVIISLLAGGLVILLMRFLLQPYPRSIGLRVRVDPRARGAELGQELGSAVEERSLGFVNKPVGRPPLPSQVEAGAEERTNPAIGESALTDASLPPDTRAKAEANIAPAPTATYLLAQTTESVAVTPKQTIGVGHKNQPASERLWADLRNDRTARFISFINFKGGVGKSTVAVEIATSLARHFGKRVLLIDLDPQTNSTFYVMDYAEWERWTQTNGSLKTLFDAYLSGQGDRFDVSRVIKKDLLCHGGTPLAPGFELLPSHLALVQIDIQLAARTAIGEAVFSNQSIIRQALQQIQHQYDYIIFDCPPNFNLVTQNGLFASDGYVIPAIPDYLSTLGINLIQGEVTRFSERIRHALAMFGGTFAGPVLKGIIFTRVRLRSRNPLRFVDLHGRRMQEVERTNPGLVFRNFISEAVRFAEAPERQLPVSLSPRPEDREARDEFLRLAEEFTERTDGKENLRGTKDHSRASTDAGEHLSGLARAS
jgi:chromosome partitioning protein